MVRRRIFRKFFWFVRMAAVMCFIGSMRECRSPSFITTNELETTRPPLENRAAVCPDNRKLINLTGTQ